MATVHAHQEGVSNEATESGSTHPSNAPTNSQEGISNETSQNNSSTGCPSDVPIGSPASLPIPLELPSTSSCANSSTGGTCLSNAVSKLKDTPTSIRTAVTPRTLLRKAVCAQLKEMLNREK